MTRFDHDRRSSGRAARTEHDQPSPGRRSLTEDMVGGTSSAGGGGGVDTETAAALARRSSGDGLVEADMAAEANAALADGCRAADDSLDGMIARLRTVRDVWLDPTNHDTRAEIEGVAADLSGQLREAQARFGAMLDGGSAPDREAATSYAEQWTREFATQISLGELMPEHRGSRQSRLFGDGTNREQAHLDHVMAQAREVSRVLNDLQHATGLTPPAELARSLDGSPQLALQTVLEHRPARSFFRIEGPYWVAGFRSLPGQVPVWSALLSAHDQVTETVEARDGVAHEMAGGDVALADDFAALAEVVHLGVEANLHEDNAVYDPVRALVGRPAADRQAFLRTLDRRGDYDAFGSYCGGLYLALREGTSFVSDPVHDARGIDAVGEGVVQYAEEVDAQWDRVRHAIANLAANGGYLITGALEGMAATDAENPALLAALDAMTAGLAAIALPPVMLAGLLAGLGEALADQAAELIEILEDPAAFAEQALGFAEVMCSAEGAEVATALGYDLGHDLCDTLIGWSEMGALELAWSFGKLGGAVLLEVILAAIGVGIATRIARFARSFRLLGPLFGHGGPHAPRLRSGGLPDGDLDAPDRLPSVDIELSDDPQPAVADEAALQVVEPAPATPANAADLLTRVKADAAELERLGRITPADRAEVYSTDDAETARRILNERLASHHDATAPSSDYTEVAAALERDGVVADGTASRVAAAADDWERQVIVDRALQQSARTRLHRSYDAARADYDRRVAAEPTREFALVEFLDGYYREEVGRWGVIDGEGRMVPIEHETCDVLAHNHPTLPDGTYRGALAMPSLFDGDAGVGWAQSVRSGGWSAQEITLSFPDGQRTVPLVVDAQHRMCWFEVPTPHGDTIQVSFEAEQWSIRRDWFSRSGLTGNEIIHWMESLWGSPLGPPP